MYIDNFDKSDIQASSSISRQQQLIVRISTSELKGWVFNPQPLCESLF